MPKRYWARLRADLDVPLRRGAWYEVRKLRPPEAVVDVSGERVSVPRAPAAGPGRPRGGGGGERARRRRRWGRGRPPAAPPRAGRLPRGRGGGRAPDPPRPGRGARRPVVPEPIGSAHVRAPATT